MRGLEGVARVEPWTTSFDPGTTTLESPLELTREVDFAAFVFAQDDWTMDTPRAPTADPAPTPGQAPPRDNVVLRPAFSAEGSMPPRSRVGRTERRKFDEHDYH